ncbi:MAG: cadherin-like beta sandwich domain-containing protein [Johnsonella sp.]|nr:cadherin-like beta sandwich domain-containing protein [Johnsonella sp.]
MMSMKPKKIIRRSAVFFTLLFALFFGTGTGEAYALDARIAFSDPSTSLESEFDVSMKVNSLDGPKIGKVDIMLSYDSQYLEFLGGEHAEGGAGSVKISASEGGSDTEWAFSLKFKALQAGESQITVSTWEIYDADGQAASLGQQGSSKITVSGGESVGADANLSSLKIAPGILAPEFSPDVTEYTTLVGTDVEKVTVSAIPALESSKVIISGNDSLVLGENKIQCQVTAQDGVTSKTYTITLTKQEGVVTQIESVGGAELSSENVSLHGIEYNIASSFDTSLLPEGFTLGRYSYNGKDVAAGHAEGQDFIIMYLIAANGSGGLYSYNPQSNQWTIYTKLTSASKAITIIPIGADVSVPEGFKENTLELTSTGVKIPGWTWASDPEERYYIVYGMNANGEKNFYRYDKAEKTIQRFFSDPAIENGISTQDFNHVQEQYNALLKDYDLRGKILIALVIALLILLAALLFILLTLGRKASAGKRRGKKEGDAKTDLVREQIKREENRGRSKVRVSRREDELKEEEPEIVDLEEAKTRNEEASEDEALNLAAVKSSVPEEEMIEEEMPENEVFGAEVSGKEIFEEKAAEEEVFEEKDSEREVPEKAGEEEEMNSEEEEEFEDLEILDLDDLDDADTPESEVKSGDEEKRGLSFSREDSKE